MSERERMQEPYEVLRPMMKKHGADGSAEAFFWTVSDAFHTAEANIYDVVHKTMFDSLAPMWNRLLKSLSDSDTGMLKVLDVGCGTGFIPNFLSNLAGDCVESCLLLDPCNAMIATCRRKQSSWRFPCKYHIGLLQDFAPGDHEFDLITVNSVLHHVVDLPAFFHLAASLLKKGGLLATCQDARAEAATDKVFQKRKRRFARQAWVMRLGNPVRIMRSTIRRLTRKPTLYTELINQINSQLLADSVVSVSLTIQEVWAICDIHVPGQPGSMGHGISLDDMRKGLPGLKLLDYFSYGFFGQDPSRLFWPLGKIEKRLFAEGDEHGAFFGSLWRLGQ